MPEPIEPIDPNATPPPTPDLPSPPKTGSGIYTGTGDGGIVTQQVIQLPGMAPGEVGYAGTDKAGATIRTVAVNPLVYIGVEMLWLYLQTFLGLLAIDGMGLADLAPPGDAFSHLYNIGGIALAPTLLGLLKELYDYLGKIRASRRP